MAILHLLRQRFAGWLLFGAMASSAHNLVIPAKLKCSSFDSSFKAPSWIFCAHLYAAKRSAINSTEQMATHYSAESVDLRRNAPQLKLKL
jgi:hypothetical protein